MYDHVTEGQECWCNPYLALGDSSVIVHNDALQYLRMEPLLIGDILIDYDGNRDAEGLMSLIDEVRSRCYAAVKTHDECYSDA